jgi:acyl carrier protein
LEIPFVPASTANEKTVVACWEEVLGLESVGLNDNFFALGGDSLHMTLIAARIREQTGVEISFEDFFERPTPVEMAGRILG